MRRTTGSVMPDTDVIDLSTHQNIFRPRLASAFADSRAAAPRLERSRLIIVVGNRPPGGAVEIVILAAAKRPQECGKTGEAEHQRQRHQDDQDLHHMISREVLRARSEFSIT